MRNVLIIFFHLFILKEPGKTCQVVIPVSLNALESMFDKNIDLQENTKITKVIGYKDINIRDLKMAPR